MQNNQQPGYFRILQRCRLNQKNLKNIIFSKYLNYTIQSSQKVNLQFALAMRIKLKKHT